MTLTPSTLTDIEQKAKAATPGPWRWADWSATFGTCEDPRRMNWLERNASLLDDPTPAIRTRQMGAIGILRVSEAFRSIGILRVDDPVDTSAHDRYSADAAFIAAANPSTVLAMVDRIRQLEAALVEALGMLDSAGWQDEDRRASLRAIAGAGK